MTFFRFIFYKIYTWYLIRKFAYEREKYEDRDVLERIIIPYVLIYRNPKTIFDIGREDYQAFYNSFFIGKELWTIDIDPERVEFGANKHITDNVVNIKKHFPDNKFDFILMNGVFGWGLNDPADIEKTISSIYDVLKPGGLFILGWNDVPDLTPIPLSEIAALKKFKNCIFPPLKSASFKSKTGEHTYTFFVKE